ncbi:kinase-like domain-containing protein [Mycena metata]|uniref:Kinase-like domain-containing protein n=1 Tax=Mycena metata TaxID=1033252 RepID=A0AAD7JL57_9AGAR|nr:kinase-like domain-containing protein [Mycena metata]
MVSLPLHAIATLPPRGITSPSAATSEALSAAVTLAAYSITVEASVAVLPPDGAGKQENGQLKETIDPMGLDLDEMRNSNAGGQSKASSAANTASQSSSFGTEFWEEETDGEGGVEDVIQTIITKNKKSMEDICARLVGFLQDAATYKAFLSLRDDSAQHLLDLLQDLLDDNSSTPSVRSFLIRALERLSRVSGRHPRSLPNPALNTEKHMDSGNYGDVWKGSVNGGEVCVKVIRIVNPSEIEGTLQEFDREALLWRQLCHPNVLPFYGIYYLEKRLCLISPWMENGNLFQYLRKKPVDMNRLSFVLDVALGVKYLHKHNVVHGDLKSANILVTPSLRACIADFGLSYCSNPVTLRFPPVTVGHGRGGTWRYQAPELLKGATNHSGSDIYAFGCVCYEIMTGNSPFYETLKDVAVILKISQGETPSRPSSWSTPVLDELWQLLQDCWNATPDLRPTATTIVKHLKGSPFQLKTPKGAPDWDKESMSEARRSLQPEPQSPIKISISSPQVAAGSSSDLFTASVHGKEVVIKVMHLFEASDAKRLVQEFGREALIWHQLCHPNVLPFYGLYYQDQRLCLISPWMKNGDLFHYLQKPPLNVDRLLFVLDVALGLEYLHGNNVVHGDLKTANILVTSSARACIADFGLSSIINPLTFQFTHTTVERGGGGTVRYVAPELFQDEVNHCRSGSDIYAFACVCYEIMTGKVPFYETINDMTVMMNVLTGQRPSMPSSWSTPLLEQFWQLLQDCWHPAPDLRPTATQIVERLRGAPFQLRIPQGPSDWDKESTSKARRSFQPGKPPIISSAQLKSLISGRGEHAGGVQQAGEAPHTWHLGSLFSTLFFGTAGSSESNLL